MQTLRFEHPEKDKALFFATLRSRVDGYFKENKLSKHYNVSMIIKSIVLLAAYLIPFAGILTSNFSNGINMLLWTIMGFALAGIGMSVMHDANHGAYSSNSKTNYWMGHTLNLLGGSVANWKIQHNILHHTYTNVAGYDDDIDDKLVFRFSPHNQVKWFHKFQFLYAIFFYGIITLYWVILKDFIQYFQFIKRGVNKDSKDKNKATFRKIVLSKIGYLLIAVVLPLVILKLPIGMYLLGFTLMHFIAGVVLTVVFQLAHTVETTTHPLPNELATIENTWAIHQLNTTVNFSRHNKFISWYVGGLNFQVEHHLFPTICHVHYPAIAPIVKQTAEEFGIPYLENETIWQAIYSHIKLLRKFGEPELQYS